MKQITLFIGLVGALACLLLPTIAYAGGQARADAPNVFRGASVNNYVLQFKGLENPEMQVDKAARLLCYLIQFDGIYSQIGFGPLGYTYLLPHPDDEQSNKRETILARLTGKMQTDGGVVDSGKGLILLSGRFERIGDDIYLMTTIDFLRRDESETVAFELPGWGDSAAYLAGTLPRQSVSFTPRKFTRRQLGAVQRAYRRYLIVRPEPDINSPGEPYNPLDVANLTFSVTARRGWLKIKPHIPEPVRGGWVQIPRDIGDLGLRDLMPELYFMDAVAIYLQSRIRIADLSSRAFNRHLKEFAARRKAFDRRARPGGDQDAVGLLDAMYGCLLLLNDTSEVTVDKATAAFQNSSTKIPSSVSARNLSSLAEFSRDVKVMRASTGRKIDVKRTEQLQRQLLQFVRAAPEDDLGKINLDQLYKWRESQGDTSFVTPKVKAFRQVLQTDPKLKAKTLKVQTLKVAPRIQVPRDSVHPR
jgi:hypothetical protein